MIEGTSNFKVILCVLSLGVIIAVDNYFFYGGLVWLPLGTAEVILYTFVLTLTPGKVWFLLTNYDKKQTAI